MNRERGHLPRPVQTTNPTQRLKLLSLGDASVGKSCLIKYFVEKKFTEEYVPTIGIDYGVKTVTIDEGSDSQKEVKVNFWDVAGDAVYFEIRNEFYKDTNGAILVYDTTTRESFTSLDKWTKELSTLTTSPVTVVLVANKIDKKPRVVSEEEGKEFAEKFGYEYFETSAATGENVQTVFNSLLKKILNSEEKKHVV